MMGSNEKLLSWQQIFLKADYILDTALSHIILLSN